MTSDNDDYSNRMVRWECEQLFIRAALGYFFANDLLDEADANDIIYLCQPISGSYPLETLDVDSVVELAQNMWGRTDVDLRPYAERACRRVWNKWESSGDVAGAAEDWAIGLIGEYAAEDGIDLHEAEETAQ